ncbi:MAG: Flp pilus assembly protein CpaB [Chloroflexi bacterium]|nr:Flp pilus assembly protein CpaB [Chloroflexota bacterium]
MRRGRIFIILGLVLALVTAFGAFLLLNQPQNAPSVQQETPTKRVVVAVQNIGAGQPILPETITMTDWPQDQIPPGAILNQAETAGKLASAPIYQGQVLQQQMLIGKDDMMLQGTHASWMIPEGMVAVAFPVNRISSVAYAIQAGDFVDVLITVNLVDLDMESQVKQPVERVGAQGTIIGKQEPRQVVQLTLQNVEILKVGDWNTGIPGAEPEPKEEKQQQASGQATPTPKGPDIITVLLDQQDALVLKFLRESGAVIDLALRARDDRSLVTTESVTLDYIMRRFDITPPPKQPYTLQGSAPADGQ